MSIPASTFALYPGAVIDRKPEGPFGDEWPETPLVGGVRYYAQNGWKIGTADPYPSGYPASDLYPAHTMFKVEFTPEDAPAVLDKIWQSRTVSASASLSVNGANNPVEEGSYDMSHSIEISGQFDYAVNASGGGTNTTFAKVFDITQQKILGKAWAASQNTGLDTTLTNYISSASEFLPVLDFDINEFYGGNFSQYVEILDSEDAEVGDVSIDVSVGDDLAGPRLGIYPLYARLHSDGSLDVYVSVFFSTYNSPSATVSAILTNLSDDPEYPPDPGTDYQTIEAVSFSFMGQAVSARLFIYAFAGTMGDFSMSYSVTSA